MSQRLYQKYRVLWMEPQGPLTSFAQTGHDHCCADMKGALTNACAEHADDPFACGDMLLSFSLTFAEYGLIVHDGGASSVLIKFCPWCGTKLPKSRRDAWFDENEGNGGS